MPSRIPAILLAAFLLNTSCNTADKTELPSVEEPKLNLIMPSFYETLKVSPASIHGVWSVEGTFMYSDILEIKRDGSFSSRDRGCMGSSYSEGSWQGSGYNYVLKSIDKLKQRSDAVFEPDTGYYYSNEVQLRWYGDTLYSSTGSKYVMKEQY